MEFEPTIFGLLEPTALSSELCSHNGNSAWVKQDLPDSQRSISDHSFDMTDIGSKLKSKPFHTHHI